MAGKDEDRHGQKDRHIEGYLKQDIEIQRQAYLKSERHALRKRERKEGANEKDKK